MRYDNMGTKYLDKPEKVGLTLCDAREGKSYDEYKDKIKMAKLNYGNCIHQIRVTAMGSNKNPLKPCGKR